MNRVYVLLFWLLASTGFAQVKLARLFSDHAVLQRQQPIPVWGWAGPNEKVSVTLATKTQTTKADNTGKWMVRFPAMEAGGPYALVVQAKSGKKEVNDLLVGEVWLCSGQSNMEWKVSQANNFQEEKTHASFPKIRHFFVNHEVTLQPEKDLPSGDWKVCSPETVGDFTAIGFFFARELSEKLNIPVGLVHSSWGGSQLEGWLSKEAMFSNEELKSYAQNFPDTWEKADAYHDKKLQKLILGDRTEDETQYTKPGYDFSTWNKADDPMGQWDWKGIWAFRGTGYMANQVEIPADVTDKPSTLVLAQNDSPNEIFINGQSVFSGVMKGLRRITVPAHTWKTGLNTLVVKMGKMQDPAWYGMGLMGSVNDLYIETPSQKISLAKGWRIRPSFTEKREYAHSSNNIGTTIYNAMIAPLVPYAIQGVLWYQGETNAGRAYQYRQTFPLLINDWRKQWNREFPFYFVQLSSYGADQSSNTGSNWAELREAQTMTLKLPHTGMAVTTDIGNPKDIHPTNKQDVGHRLAIVALEKAYGQPFAGGSPLYEAVQFQGNQAVVSFTQAKNGLTVKDKYGYLKGFEIAGDDHVFYYAPAEIKGNTVIVSHPKVSKPVAVRYAWSDAPAEANLFSTEGYPASSFRTDSWPGVTLKGKFE